MVLRFGSFFCRWSLQAQPSELMDPAPARNARRVHWVSFSQGEAESGLPFMMAICRPNGIVHWLLRPVMNLMDPENIGYFNGGRKLYRESGFQEEFGLSEDYPWFIVSRRALQIQRRKDEADGGSLSASSEPLSEQFFGASSAGLLGLLLQWEKGLK